MSWHGHLRKIFKPRYTRELEDEVARLRNENRAMMNSILSVAGLPPLRLEAEVAREKHRAEIEVKGRRDGALDVGQQRRAGKHEREESSKSTQDSITAGDNDRSMPTVGGQGIVLPSSAHRRRSWQQINRILEIEEARQVANRDNSDAMRPRRS